MEMTTAYWETNSIRERFLYKTIKHQVQGLGVTHDEEFIRFYSLYEMSLSEELKTLVFLFVTFYSAYFLQMDYISC